MATDSAAPDLVAAAEEVAPLAAELAEAGETARRLPSELVEALRSAGLFRLFVPRAYGGPELDPLTGLSVIETMARADGSAGWCVNIAATTSTMSWYLPPDFAAHVYSDPGVITGGTFAPNGRGVAEAGGWRVSGQWPWGSGTQHCDWVNCGVRTDNGEFHLMYVPAAEVEFLDTWYTSGLRGTGSTDFVVRDVFVPSGHTLLPGITRTHVDAPLCHFPNFGLLAAGLASVALGIGRRAVDELRALAVERTPALSSKTLAQSTMVQVDLARAEAAVGAGRAFLREQVAAMWDRVRAGERIPIADRSRLRLAAHHATAEAARATDLAYTAAGGGSVYSSSPLQRCLRDVHVATQHAMVSTRNLESFGSIALGQPADTSLL